MNSKEARGNKPIAGGADDAAALGPLYERSARRGRASKLALLAMLVAGLGAVAYVASGYVAQSQQGAAAASLPPVDVVASSGAPHFLFAINGVSRPLGVAVAPRGDRIYVTESDGNRETKEFDRDGHPVGTLNPPGSDPSSRVPVYAAVDAEGKVFVSDRGTGSVHTYSPEGSYLGEFEPPAELKGAWNPLALAFDPSGNLLVTNLTAGKHGVLSIGRDGKVVSRREEGVSPEDPLSYPNGVVADQTGRILVSDSNNARVVVIEPNGAAPWSFGQAMAASGIGLPRGIAVDAQKHVYVADTVNHNLLVFEIGDRNAKLLFKLGGQGIGNGQFNFPNGVAVDQSGRLYVTDRENNRVQVWSN